MILNHVADGADLFIKCAAALDAEILRHRDLHAFDVMPVPERFKHGIAEAEEENVVHGRLAQIMINSEDGPLIESLEQDGIEGPGRGKVATERLFNDHAGIPNAT